MTKLDTIELCKRDIEILAYIRKSTTVVITAIADTFSMSYRKANRMVTKYADGGYVDKFPIESISQHGDHFTFSITKKGINVLENMYKVLQESKGSQ
jgi:predicted transcriptional regulator